MLPIQTNRTLMDGLYLRVRRTGGRSSVPRRKRGGHVEVITVGAWPGTKIGDGGCRGALYSSHLKNAASSLLPFPIHRAFRG
jgi:hypothetical protein